MEALGPPVERRVIEDSYIDLQRRGDSPQGHHLRRYWKGHYLPALPDPAIEVLLAHDPSIGASLQTHGGAIADVPQDATAFAHRRTAFEYMGAARWTDPAEDAARMATVRACAGRMEPFASGAYVNALSDDGASGVGRAYPPAVLARLTALKDSSRPGERLPPQPEHPTEPAGGNWLRTAPPTGSASSRTGRRLRPAGGSGGDIREQLDLLRRRQPAS